MALYLLVVHPRLYTKATVMLKLLGKRYPNPFAMVHGQTATTLSFMPFLKRQFMVCVELKSLEGVSCHD